MYLHINARIVKFDEGYYKVTVQQEPICEDTDSCETLDIQLDVPKHNYEIHLFILLRKIKEYVALEIGWVDFNYVLDKVYKEAKCLCEGILYGLQEN